MAACGSARMRSAARLSACALALASAISAGAARAQAPATYTVVIRDGRMTPGELEVPAHARIKLVLRNEGARAVEFENLDLRVEKVLAPGVTSFVIVHTPAPGRYRFVDEFHPDTASMVMFVK